MGCKGEKSRIKKNKRAGWKINRRKTKKDRKKSKIAKLKFQMKKGVREGSSKIWYLEYKISEALVVKLKKQCNNNCPTNRQLAKVVKGIERTQVF